jgi:hypothetical protein
MGKDKFSKELEIIQISAYDNKGRKSKNNINKKI